MGIWRRINELYVSESGAWSGLRLKTLYTVLIRWYIDNSSPAQLLYKDGK